MVRKTKILLVDDHPLIREGLTQYINQEADLSVCGEADTASNALEAMEDLNPDMVIADISLGKTSGFRFISDAKQCRPDLRVLVLSMHDENIYAERALRAGAEGYIMKQASPNEVMQAIRRILDGEIYVSEAIASRMLRRLTDGTPDVGSNAISHLSNRELEVFQLIGCGHGTREIARILQLSHKTIETYRAHIKKKMHLRNAAELVQHAVQWMQSNAS